jgi:RimJ/RimL family protein N-acetyltransferase
MGRLPETLVADQVVLRRWSTGRTAALAAAVDVSFDELHRWLPWATARSTPSAFAAVVLDGIAAFDEDREWTYTVGTDGDGRVLGSVGLHPGGGPSSVEIGYWIRSDVTGRGYATMAAHALTSAAFRYLPDIDRVEIRMDAANRASASVPPRLGYVLDRVVDDPGGAPGRTGRTEVWVMERARWAG